MAASRGSTAVAFAGCGNIGLPMALALIRAGWSLTVYDPVRAKTGELADAGASVATSPEELSSCDVLVLAVPDDAAVESLLEGPKGWLDQGGADRTVIVHSTVMPETASRLAETASHCGVGLLDAPVSGGADRAERGDLTIMVGGDEEVLERVRPLLETEGSRIVRVGPAGAGAATKLGNQLMMLSALAGVHEALELAAAHGVSEASVLDVVTSCTGESWVTRNWDFFDRTSAAYDAGGTAKKDRPWSKDLFEVVQAARAADVRVPVAGLLSQVLAEKVEAHAARAAVPEGDTR
jgi:3-hydroxyisobutyrate dehydrogenase-like beta-hydroxyacid dehydrogenase